jgi:predicted MPP superfamily phosphohydrolase
MGWGLTAGGVVACISAPLYASRIEPSWIEVTRVDIGLPDLPDGLDGLTIAQLSDLHSGPYVSREMLHHSVEMTNALNPDLVVLTGDFVYKSYLHIAVCALELAALKARYGLYAVMGNHDMWNDPGQITASLSGVGIRVLRNEKAPLSLGSSTLWLLGVDNASYLGEDYPGYMTVWQEAKGNLARLLEGIPGEDTRILLVHNPDFTEILPEGRVDLALCGHTHGGQVRLPLIGAPVVPSHFGQKYAAGLVQSPTTLVYVNRGIGLIPPAVRFNCRPEITLLRLTKKR